MPYIRIMHEKSLVKEDLYNDPKSFEKILSFAQSKIGTAVLYEGASKWDVLESTPMNGSPVCKVLLAYSKLKIHFPAVSDDKIYNLPRLITLNPGGAVAYTGIDIDEIKILENENIEKHLHYNIFEFAMAPKKIKGVGSNKYKVSLTLSDTYEIEIMADSEEHAKSQAIDMGLQFWDHIYNYKHDLNSYRHQQTRYSIWHPSQVVAKPLL